jgi:spermidine synthase
VDEADYHETMVHIPLSLIKKDRPKVLVLGGGDGLIIRELLKHNNLDKITQIELDEDFFLYSKNDLDIKKLNNSSLDSLKLEVIFQDAFSFLRKNKKLYDFIVIDFPYPYSYDLAKLYSVEFYSLVHKSLSKNGFFVMDLPLFSKQFFKRKTTINIEKNSRDINNILYSTIKKSNFLYTHFYMLGDLEGYVLASKHEQIIDWNKLTKDERIQSVKSKKLSFINNEVPHEYKEELVNSIFKPTILKFTDEINKY